MTTKKVRISALVTIEETACNELLKSSNIDMDLRFSVNDGKHSLFYRYPEIRSVKDLKIIEEREKVSYGKY